MKIKIKLCAILLIAITFSPFDAEAQSSDLPSWVDNPSQQFSENQFLMAVGSAPTREGARKKAQGNLAQIFVADVNVEEEYINEFEEITSSEEGTSTEEQTNLITRSEISSDQQLRNMQIKEVYEADNGIFYALAVMDRMETSQLYTEEINRKREAISSLQQKADQTDSKLEQLIYMKQAFLHAQIIDMLTNQRAILTGQTTQTEAESLSDITQAYREAKQQCTISLNGEEIPRQVQSTVSRQLQNEGFTVIADRDSEQPVIRINLDLMMEPVDLNRPNAEFIQWALQIEAQNQENGRWFSTYTADGREGSMNEQYARKRAIQAVQEKISSEFTGYINDELLSVR